MTTDDYIMLCIALSIIPGLTLMILGIFIKNGWLSRKSSDSIYSNIAYSLMIITALIIAYYNFI